MNECLNFARVVSVGPRKKLNNIYIAFILYYNREISVKKSVISVDCNVIFVIII